MKLETIKTLVDNISSLTGAQSGFTSRLQAGYDATFSGMGIQYPEHCQIKATLYDSNNETYLGVTLDDGLTAYELCWFGVSRVHENEIFKLMSKIRMILKP
jgi:hypothetical protein